jgi:hypothetical protein
MLVALALYTSTAHAGIPAGCGGTPGVSRMQTSLTEDQRALPKHSQRLPETSVPRATELQLMAVEIFEVEGRARYPTEGDRVPGRHAPFAEDSGRPFESATRFRSLARPARPGVAGQQLAVHTERPVELAGDSQHPRGRKGDVHWYLALGRDVLVDAERRNADVV